MVGFKNCLGNIFNYSTSEYPYDMEDCSHIGNPSGDFVIIKEVLCSGCNEDCAGVVGGSAELDNCGVCGGDGSTCIVCADCDDSECCDCDGNVYETVQIGTQLWMKENLKATHYNNGDIIPNITNGGDWTNLTTGAYCDYNNSTSNAETYGRLYNWYAVDDSRGICPIDYHVPTNAEWTILTDF